MRCIFLKYTKYFFKAAPFSDAKFLAIHPCQQIQTFPKRGGNDVNEQKGYIGRIQNTGTQVVKAPHQITAAKTGTVKTGKDLRTGK